MTVRAIGQDDRSSSLNTIIKSTAAGTVAGYAMKWIWPVTKQEDTFSRREILEFNRKAANRKKVDEIKAQGEKTNAQVVFVNMIDSEDKDAFKDTTINKKIKILGGEGSSDAKELRRLIKDVKESANKAARFDIIGRKIGLKYMRPVIPFLVAGAGVGFFGGFAHNVMKTDYYA